MRPPSLPLYAVSQSHFAKMFVRQCFSGSLATLGLCAPAQSLPASARIHIATQPHGVRAQQPALAGSFEHDVLKAARCNPRSGAG